MWRRDFCIEEKERLSSSTAFLFLSFGLTLIQYSIQVAIVTSVRVVQMPTGFTRSVQQAFCSAGPRVSIQPFTVRGCSHKAPTLITFKK